MINIKANIETQQLILTLIPYELNKEVLYLYVGKKIIYQDNRYRIINIEINEENQIILSLKHYSKGITKSMIIHSYF